MLDQDAISTLILAALKAVGTNNLYWALMALVAADVAAGTVQAAAGKDLDPSLVKKAGHKFFQATAAIAACMAMEKASPNLVTVTYPIMGTIAVAEGLSLLGNMRKFWEAKGEPVPAWIDALTVFLRGFPSQTQAALALAPVTQDPPIEATVVVPAAPGGGQGG